MSREVRSGRKQWIIKFKAIRIPKADEQAKLIYIIEITYLSTLSLFSYFRRIVRDFDRFVATTRQSKPRWTLEFAEVRNWADADKNGSRNDKSTKWRRNVGGRQITFRGYRSKERLHPSRITDADNPQSIIYKSREENLQKEPTKRVHNKIKKIQISENLCN